MQKYQEILEKNLFVSNIFKIKSIWRFKSAFKICIDLQKFLYKWLLIFVIVSINLSTCFQRWDVYLFDKRMVLGQVAWCI